MDPGGPFQTDQKLQKFAPYCPPRKRLDHSRNSGDTLWEVTARLLVAEVKETGSTFHQDRSYMDLNEIMDGPSSNFR